MLWFSALLTAFSFFVFFLFFTHIFYRFVQKPIAIIPKSNSCRTNNFRPTAKFTFSAHPDIFPDNFSDQNEQLPQNYPVEQQNLHEQSNGRLTPNSNSDASMQDSHGNQQHGKQNLENQQLNNEQNNSSHNQNSQNKPATTGRRVIQVQQQHKFVKIERSQTYGFGFILRGTRSHTDKKTEFQPSNLYPARQFLESVDVNGPAGAAGLAAGDYLINVNNSDVRTWGHDDLVQLIRSQHSMTMHVISVTKHKGTTVGFFGNVIRKVEILFIITRAITR